MFQGQRIELLKQIVIKHKTVDISTLCNELKVSDVTVRKYLDMLENEGFLIRFRGGVMLNDADLETEYRGIEADIDDEEVDQVATLAATLIEDGDSVFIGHGRLCFALSKKLGNFNNLTIITNNFNIVPNIVSNVRNLYFIGGEVLGYNGNIYSCGTKALRQLEHLSVQKSFIGVDGVDQKVGVTVSDSELYEILMRVVEISREVIILVEHNKFNKVGLHKLSNIDQFKIYVTGKEVDSKYKQYFFNNDIKLLTPYNTNQGE